MIRLPSDMTHWLFIYRKLLGSYDVYIIGNIELISLTDKGMKLCAQRIQNKTNLYSNYDIRMKDHYLVLTKKIPKLSHKRFTAVPELACSLFSFTIVEYCGSNKEIT